MKTSKLRWVRQTIVFFVIAAMAIALFPLSGLNSAKAEEGDTAAGFLLMAESESYKADVTYGPEAEIPEGAVLELTEFQTGSAEFAEIKEAIVEEDNGLDDGNFGMAAFDLTIYDEAGNVVEPAAPVQVNIQMKELPADMDVETVKSTMALHHLDESDGEVVVETVATALPDEAGDISVAEDAATAEFTVDSLSPFVLTWKNGEATDPSATIYWGTIGEDGTFTEFQKADLDTAVGSIDLRASYSGYQYVDAVYYENKPETVNINASEEVEGRTFINDIIKKETATGDTGNYQWLAEDSHHGATEFAVKNGSYIYAVYEEPDPDSPTPSTPENPEEPIPTPTTRKTIITNKNADGTPDGTYTIQLDIEGKQVTETEQTGANVIIVYDVSQSMTTRLSGNTTRLDASNQAMHTLISTLKPGTNDIDMAIVTFAGDATKHNFGSSTSPSYWTKTGNDILGVVDSFTNQNINNNRATNWNQAMEYAYQLGQNAPDSDDTYIIFITDGCPSVNSLASQGHSHGAAGTTNTDDLCYTSALAWAKLIAGTKGSQISTTVRSGNSSWTIPSSETDVALGMNLYGIYTGTDTNNMLGRLITAAGGKSTITATSATAIEQAFQNIAQTIVDNLGATGVTTTDEVTALSSLNAEVSGAAGAFEYYRWGGENADGTEKYNHEANNGLGETWSDAPGAIFNDDGSVTWDLSSIGATEAKVHYVLRFTVWPSQEAYDLIANLNNGTQAWDDLDPSVQNQINKDGNNYSLKTNGDLKTSYTFNGTTYTDNIQFENGSMALVSEEMDVRKAWDDAINRRNRAKIVDFYLYELRGETRYYYQTDGSFATGTDNAYVLTVEDNGNGDTDPDNWKASIEIAPGVMKNGDILESGHMYALEEAAAYDKNGNKVSGYSMEFTTQTVRPMVINGALTYLVLVDEDNPAPAGKTRYYIDDEAKTYRAAEEADTENVYYVASTSEGEVVGTNHKSSELDITKRIDEKNSVTDKTSDELSEEKFTYTITLTAPEGSDTTGVKYWRYRAFTDEDAAAGEEGEYTGYPLPEYGADAAAYAPKDYSTSKKYIGDDVGAGLDEGQTVSFTNNTAEVEVTIDRTEIIRFTNLPTGTKYTIIESAANDNPIADQGYTISKIDSTTKEPTLVKESEEEDAKITGLDGEINEYAVRYYNQFENVIYAVDAELKVTKAMNYAWSVGDADGYTFTLEAKDDAPLPFNKEGTTVTIESDSKLTDTFGTIRFTEAGEYEYTITETEGENPNILYGGPAAVKVTVEEIEEEQEDETTVKKLVVSSITVDGKEALDDSTSPVSAAATITNTYVTTTATITVTKALAGAAWPEDETEAATKLTLTLSGTNNAPMPEETTAELTAAGDATFGPITYTLSDAGNTYTYTISEDGFDSDKGWSGSGDVTATVTVTETDGELEASVSYSPSATITNTYEATGSVELEVIKAVAGADWPEDAKLTLTLSGTGGTLPEETTAELTEAGTATFGAISYTLADAGKTYTYTISEDGFGDGWSSSGNVTAKVTVTDNGDGTLATEVEYSPEDDTITNTYSADGEAVISVTKAIAGADWPEDAKLTLTLSGTGGTLPEETTAELTEAGTATFGAISYTLEDAGKTYTYTISEDGFGKGWTSSGDITATVTVTDQGDGNLTTDVKYSPENATITNTYKATGKVELEVTKALAGADWPEGKKLTLTLSGTGGTLPEETTAELTAAGKATFGAISYTEADAGKTYTYTISEGDGFGKGWTGSGSVTATVTVTDNGDGTLATDVTYSSDDKITNTYEATGKVELEVTKALAGADWPEGKKLTLTLSGEGGTLPEETTAELTAAGKATFGAISYTEADAGKTYTYTISEGDGFGKGWTGSGDITATVTVTDNGDGTLATDVTYSSDDKITNTYKATGKATLIATKEVAGADWPEGKTLTFTLTGEEGKPMPATTTATVTKDKSSASFGPINYTEADAGKTYTYTISEDGFGDDWTGSESITATVKVNDNGDGTLTPEVTYSNNGKIINTYTPRFGDLIIEKELESFGGDSEKVLFAFHVTATKDGKPVYDDYVGLEFTKEGFADGEVKKQATIKGKIPVGAVVTVTEMTPGGGYKFVGMTPTEPVTIDGKTAAKVTFTNKHDGPGETGGIVNRYNHADSSWIVENTGDNSDVPDTK